MFDRDFDDLLNTVDVAAESAETMMRPGALSKISSTPLRTLVSEGV
jgi:hypothetical protein